MSAAGQYFLGFLLEVRQNVQELDKQGYFHMDNQDTAVNMKYACADQRSVTHNTFDTVMKSISVLWYPDRDNLDGVTFLYVQCRCVL